MWPDGTICCYLLPDLSGAVCDICEGACSLRGKAGHLQPLERCGCVLSAGDRASLSVKSAGGSIAYSYRHSCRVGAQITVSAPNLIVMLAQLSAEVRAAFLAAAQAWFDAKKKIAASAVAGGGSGGASGGGGGGGGGARPRK